MALIKAFTDDSGNANPNCYWRIGRILISTESKEVTIHFLGYRDQDAYTAGRKPLRGADKVYAVAGDAYTAVAQSPAVGATLYNVISRACETFALATLDTFSGHYSDPDNTVPIFISFFDGATVA